MLLKIKICHIPHTVQGLSKALVSWFYEMAALHLFPKDNLKCAVCAGKQTLGMKL